MKVDLPSRSEFFISPFEVDIKEYSGSANVGGEFVATWLDANVALKLFVLDAANSTLAEEVRLWHQLRHPNVIKLYGACDVGNNFFVCELAENAGKLSLEVRGRRSGSVGVHPPRDIGACVSSRTWYYPGNLRGSSILVENDGLAKLTNFGLSGASEALDVTVTRSFVGSMRWQAPELLEGEKPSRSSDMYALGLCVIEALTGKIPWSEYDEAGAKWRKNRWQPESYDGWCEPAVLPTDLRGLLNQMCCRDPKLREPLSICVRVIEQFAENKLDRQNSGEPEPEPHIRIAEYCDGNLIKMWRVVQDHQWL